MKKLIVHVTGYAENTTRISGMKWTNVVIYIILNTHQSPSITNIGMVVFPAPRSIAAAICEKESNP